MHAEARRDGNRPIERDSVKWYEFRVQAGSPLIWSLNGVFEETYEKMTRLRNHPSQVASDQSEIRSSFGFGICFLLQRASPARQLLSVRVDLILEIQHQESRRADRGRQGRNACQAPTGAHESPHSPRGGPTHPERSLRLTTISTTSRGKLHHRIRLAARVDLGSRTYFVIAALLSIASNFQM